MFCWPSSSQVSLPCFGTALQHSNSSFVRATSYTLLASYGSKPLHRFSKGSKHRREFSVHPLLLRFRASLPFPIHWLFLDVAPFASYSPLSFIQALSLLCPIGCVCLCCQRFAMRHLFSEPGRCFTSEDIGGDCWFYLECSILLVSILPPHPAPDCLRLAMCFGILQTPC